MSDVKKYTVADIDAIGDFIFKESNIGDKLVKIQKSRDNASGTETWVKKDKYYWDNNGYDVGNNELYNWLYKSLTSAGIVEIYTDGKEMKEDLTQYYGLNSNGSTVYVAMSAEEVRNYAKKHPEEDIVKIEDNNYNYHSLVESLKRFDRKEFDENSNTYELEMLYESVKTTLSAQQKNDLARFVRKAKTAEEVNTYMTGMLVQDQTNESFDYDEYEEELTEDYEETLERTKDIFYELEDYLNTLDNLHYIDDMWYDGYSGTINFFIENGDWKHDHLRLKHYVTDWLNHKGIGFSYSENEEPSDSDVYSAQHIFNLKV